MWTTWAAGITSLLSLWKKEVSALYFKDLKQACDEHIAVLVADTTAVDVQAADKTDKIVDHTAAIAAAAAVQGN